MKAHKAMALAVLLGIGQVILAQDVPGQIVEDRPNTRIEERKNDARAKLKSTPPERSEQIESPVYETTPEPLNKEERQKHEAFVRSKRALHDVKH